MRKVTLVIMAAGIGSRFGGGIKQLEPIGPNGEIIIDYSIKDALAAGFNKVVFVIRRDLEKDFKEIIGQRIEKLVEVGYVFQEKEDIPSQYAYKVAERVKPWGTGQAILCCKEVVNEPFLVINADDYYGKQAYKEAYQYLTEERTDTEKLPMCMVSFILKNTLSDNGGVTRGICVVDEEKTLKDIIETPNIIKCLDGAYVDTDEGNRFIDIESMVSMNMWGFFPEIFDVLGKLFVEFLEKIEVGGKGEFLLPTIVGQLLRESKAEVKVLTSKDKWFGITYKEDKEAVMEAVKALAAEEG